MNQRIPRVAMLAGLACVLLGLGAGSCNDGQPGPDLPPNIVFLLVDDLRWDVFGHMGYPVETPAIDRLAAQGLRFENAFVTSSLCSPSRASFLTGVYPHVHGVTGNLTDLDYDKFPMIGALLQERGYRTAMIGKWHMGWSAAPRPGYDEWFSFPGQGQYGDPEFNHNDRIVRHAGYNTDILTEQSIRFIRENRDRPFFLHLGYKAVHAPRTPAPRHAGRYAGTEWPSRPNAAEPRSIQERDAETMLAVDDSVGRIVAALDEAGILDRTFLVFTSDNGHMFGEHGRVDKRVFYEESIRIPWIVRYPPLARAGSTRSQPVLNIDLVPTLLELAGAERPDHVQGRSFLELLRDPEASWRDRWVYEYFRELEWPTLPTMLALRTDRYKYAAFPEGPDLFGFFGGEPHLYDLEKDPYELNNVADDPQYAETRDELAAELEAFRTAPEFRTFPLDPKQVREQIENLKRTRERFRERMEKHYPDGWPADGS